MNRLLACVLLTFSAIPFAMGECAIKPIKPIPPIRLQGRYSTMCQR